MTGPLALVGSGEFTPSMDEVDGMLLDAVEEAGFERAVAVIPTAAAPDGDATVRKWLRMAHEHYEALDAEVLEVDVRDRAGATALRHVADVAEAGLVYLSGGKPDHLSRTLSGTPLLDAIVEVWKRGGALAGCSAGAMTISAGWPPFMPSSREWGHGLGLLPNVYVVPHFDRFRRMTLGAAGRIGKRAPSGGLVLGVDEDTALVHMGESGDGTWRTFGRGASWHLGPDGAVALDHGLVPAPR